VSKDTDKGLVMVSIALSLASRGCVHRVAVGLLLAAAMGCAGETPPSAEPAGAPAQAKGVTKYKVRGTVLPGADSPAGTGMVALLLPGGMLAQLRQSRTLVTAAPSPTNLWPYDSFQKFVARVQDQAPISGTLTTAQGAFEFEDLVAPGTYLVTIGIPTRRDVGRPLPPDWPTLLRTTQNVTLAGCELMVPALSGWFIEVKG
jgi:hypothetical protein